MSAVTKTDNSNNKYYPWLVMIGFFFLSWGGIGTILNASGVFFVPVCKELGFSFSGLSWWVTCYAFGMVVSMPFVGRLLPKVDTRILLTIAFLVAISAMAAMSTYTKLWQWYLSGVLIGLSGGFIFLVPGPVILSNWFNKRRGFAVGVATMGICVGASITGPLGNALIHAYGWRTTYLLLALISCILVLPWTTFIIRYDPAEKGMKPYGWDLESEQEARDKNGIKPGVPFKKVFSSFSFICLFLVGDSALDGGFGQHWPNIALTLGYTTTFGATMISMTHLPGIIMIPLAGWLNDLWGARNTTYFLVSCTALCFIGLLSLHEYPVVVLGCCLLFNAQIPIVSVQIPLMTREVFGPKDFPKILSTLQIGIGLIGAFSAPIIGSFYDRTGHYTGAFYFGLGIAVVVFTLTTGAYFGKRWLAWEDVTTKDCLKNVAGKHKKIVVGCG